MNAKQVVLLTDLELEPWHIFQQMKTESGLELRESSAEDLALSTAALYFKDTEQPPTATPPEETFGKAK